MVQAPGRVAAVLGRARIDRLVRIGVVMRVEQAAISAVEPQPVFDEWPARRRVDLVHLLDVVDGCEPLRLQRRAKVVRLQAAAGELAEQVCVEAVTAFFRHGVGDDAARPRFRRRSACRDRHLLGRSGVERVRVVVPAAGIVHVVERHPVQEQRHLIVTAPVDLHRLPQVAAGSADVPAVRERDLNPGHQDRKILERSSGRQLVQKLGAQRGLLAGRLHVDQRALARHRHRFLQRADRHGHVDRRGERRRQRDAFADHRPEPGERERHPVGTCLQRDDAELPLPVREDRACLFDERRTRCLYGDAGQDPAAGVTDDAGYFSVLSGGVGREECERQQAEKTDEERACSHRVTPKNGRGRGPFKI